jgi:hypothetical protein
MNALRVLLMVDSTPVQPAPNVRFRFPVKPDAQGERIHLSAEISPGTPP